MMGLVTRIVTVGSLLLCAVNSTLGQNCRWEDRLPLPDARIGESMAYDDERGVSVLFGGLSGKRLSSDTWVWDGFVWNHRSVTGPSGRGSHKLVYDSQRKVVVLFGGDDGKYRGDTWEWDGTQWHQRASVGPSPRGFHAMAYDSARRVTVVYGGIEGSAFVNVDDTWEWDGTVWERVAVTGPNLEVGAEMTYDASRGVCVLHGNADATTTAMETWEWDGQAWTRASTGGPLASTVFAFNELTYDSARRVVVMHVHRETWEYDGGTWVLRSTGGPAGGSATFAFAYDRQRERTVLFQGLDTANTAEWDGKEWSYSLVDRPVYMEGPAMVYDANEGVTLLVGDAFGTKTAETWAWDGGEWELRSSGVPLASIEHAMAYDSGRGVTTLFGGRRKHVRSGETWEFDGEEWTDVSVSGPSPRKSAAMAYDSVRNVTVLFGGHTISTGVNQEVWEWDGFVWTQQQAFPDVRLPDPAMAFDTKRNVVVLAGYTPDLGGMFETWEFDGQNWEFRSARSQVGSRNGKGSIVFDERLGACVYSNEWSTWVWNGADWIANTSNNSGVGESRVSYDIKRDAMVFFLHGQFSATTVWEYGCECYADCDESGVLDMLDFLCFQDSFVRGTREACNCDTTTGTNTCDIFDFLCFQSAFVGGCP